MCDRTQEELKMHIKFSSENLMGGDQLGWKDNIKVDLTLLWCEDVNCMQLVGAIGNKASGSTQGEERLSASQEELCLLQLFSVSVGTGSE
jgi:hypothetical protein